MCKFIFVLFIILISVPFSLSISSACQQTLQKNSMIKEGEQVNFNALSNDLSFSGESVSACWADLNAGQRQVVMNDPIRGLEIVDKSPAIANQYFTANPGQIGSNPIGQAYLNNQRRAAFTVEPNSPVSSYDAASGRLANGDSIINIKEYSTTDKITVLDSGGFIINGVFVGGGTIKKAAEGQYEVRKDNTNYVRFTIPTGPDAKPPKRVEITDTGFIIEGNNPAMPIVVTSNGVKIDVNIRSGRVAVLNDGQIAADDAKVYNPKTGRLYDGRFVTKGDETSLLPRKDGKQSNFYDFNTPTQIAVRTNGGEVAIHSNQLDSQTQPSPTTPPPSNMQEAENRAKNTQPIQPPPKSNTNSLYGEVWYKDNVVVAKGQVQVTGHNGVEAFKFKGTEKNSDFYRSFDADTNTAITTAKGKNVISIGQIPLTGKASQTNPDYVDKNMEVRVAADSTIYTGKNPEQILFVGVTNKLGDAIKVDAPNDGLSAMKITRKTHAYQNVGDVVSGTVAVDKGLIDFDVIVSKKNGKLSLGLSDPKDPKKSSALSLLGEAKKQNMFITLVQDKDFFISGMGDNSNVFFTLNKEGGLMESSGQWTGILGPSQVRDSLGKLILVKPEEAEKLGPIITGMSSTDPKELAALSAAGISQDTINKIFAGDPAVKMLFNCVNKQKSCKNPDEFFKALANFNRYSSQPQSGEYAVAYFDLTVASGVKPDAQTSSAAALFYLKNNDYENANRVKTQAKDKNIDLYVNTVTYLNDVNRDAKTAQQELKKPENLNLYRFENGVLTFEDGVSAEDKKRILELFKRSKRNSDPDELGTVLSLLGQIQDSSPMAGPGKTLTNKIEQSLLAKWELSARGQAEQTSEQLQERASPSAITGIGRAIVYGDRADEQERAAGTLTEQSAGMRVMRKASEQGYTVDQISHMQDSERIAMIHKLYPATKTNPQAEKELMSYIDASLGNPSVKTLILLENGNSVNSVKTQIPPSKLTVAVTGVNTPISVLFPESYVETPLLDNMQPVEYVFGGINLISSTIATAGLGEIMIGARAGAIGSQAIKNFPTLVKAGEFASTNLPTLSGAASRIALMGAEGVVGMAFEQDLANLGIDPSLAMVASGIVSFSPGSKVMTFLDDAMRVGVEFVDETGETVIVKAVRTEKNGLKKMILEDGREITSGELLARAGSNEFTFADDGLNVLAREAFQENEAAASKFIMTHQDEIVTSELQAYKVDKEFLAETNKKLGTKFEIDENGNLVGAADDFQKAGLTVNCP